MQIVQDYYALHARAEPDRQLDQTLQYIKGRLSGLSCQLFTPTEGSLCAFFDYGKEKTLAFRADADALLVDGQPMHLCGHDGHSAILLELARRCAPLACNLLLIWQPAEETSGGARDICCSGILAQTRVAAIFGLHVWPKLPAGKLYSRSGCLMSCSSQVSARFTGKSGHIAFHTAGDALSAACRFYHRAASLRDRGSHLLKFGALHGGCAPNIICDEAQLLGSLRCTEEKQLKKLQRRLTGIGKSAAYFTGCRSQVQFSDGYPAVCNDDALLKKVTKLFPVENIPKPFFTTDDFSYYQQLLPGVYFLLGLGDVPPLHSRAFAFDPRILSAGADFFWHLCQNAAMLL